MDYDNSRLECRRQSVDVAWNIDSIYFTFRGPQQEASIIKSSLESLTSISLLYIFLFFTLSGIIIVSFHSTHLVLHYFQSTFFCFRLTLKVWTGINILSTAWSGWKLSDNVKSCCVACCKHAMLLTTRRIKMASHGSRTDEEQHDRSVWLHYFSVFWWRAIFHSTSHKKWTLHSWWGEDLYLRYNLKQKHIKKITSGSSSTQEAGAPIMCFCNGAESEAQMDSELF